MIVFGRRFAAGAGSRSARNEMSTFQWEEADIHELAHVAKWAEVCGAAVPGELKWMFRGHSNSAYKLSPTLARELPDGTSYEEALRTESLAHRVFDEQAHLHLTDWDKSRDPTLTDRWAMMQHFRAPTRLLDWTCSLYVATYFAVCDVSDSDGMVWGMNCEHYDRDYGESEPVPSESAAQEGVFTTDGNPKLYVVQSTRKSPRMLAQQSVFTVCTDPRADHGEVLAEVAAEHNMPKVLLKWRIPADRKLPLLRELRGVNITAASLFPGADGLGTATMEAVRALR